MTILTASFLNLYEHASSKARAKDYDNSYHTLVPCYVNYDTLMNSIDIIALISIKSLLNKINSEELNILHERFKLIKNDVKVKESKVIENAFEGISNIINSSIEDAYMALIYCSYIYQLDDKKAEEEKICSDVCELLMSIKVDVTKSDKKLIIFMSALCFHIFQEEVNTHLDQNDLPEDIKSAINYIETEGYKINVSTTT